MSKMSVYFQLERWFERQKRVLPWRDHPTIYRVWVSEIMLQQTQVATVIPYFERFMDWFPTVDALAGASIDDVLHLWSGLGYYSRARNLHRAAQMIVAGGGQFPQTRAEWLEIPGVGPYTAGAILSIALDRPEAILDGNVERVMSRVGRVTRQKGDAHYKARLWEMSQQFVEEAFELGIRPNVLNQALMELGATVCTPRAPRCERCPLRNECRARRCGDVEDFPPRRPKKAWITVHEEMHCLVQGGQVLLRKRGAREWREGLWDLLENRPSVASRATLIGKVETKHVVTRHKVKRTTYVWKSARKIHGVNSSADMKWVSLQNPAIAIGSALKKTLERVVDELALKTG